MNTLCYIQVGFFRLRRKEGIVKQREEMTQLQGSAATATTAAAASLDSKPEKPDEDTLTEKSEEPELDEKPVSLVIVLSYCKSVCSCIK